MSSEAASTTTSTTTTAPSPVVAAPVTSASAPTPTPTGETSTTPAPAPAPSVTPTPDATATAAPSANVVAIQPPPVAAQPGAAQVTVQPTPTPGAPEQAAAQAQAQAQAQVPPGQVLQPGQVILAPGQPGVPGQFILLQPQQPPGQPGQQPTPDGQQPPLPLMSMPPTVTASSSATSIAAAAAAAAALAAAMNSTGPAPGTLTGANNTMIPQGMTPVYIPGYPPGTVMTHAQYMQIQGQAAEFAANNQLVNIGGVAQVPPLNPGDLGPHYSHHHFNTYAEFQGWKDSIQSQHGDYIVSGAVRTLKDGCRSFTLVCAVSGPYRKHRHKQGKTEPEVQAIASRPNRSKPSKKQGKMCTARMRIRHDAKDHVYVKFYPVHNHPWNPNDISHLRQLRLTASIKAKIEEQLKLNVPVKQILANVHQYQMADAIAQGATPEQQLQIKREQLINRTDIKNIQYKLQQQAAIARGEVPAKQKKPNPKRKMVIWNGPGSTPLTFNNDPNTDPAAAVAAAQAAHQAAQAAQAVQAVQQAAQQAGQQPTSNFTLQAPTTTPMDTTPTNIPQTAAQAVAAAMEDSVAKRQKLDHPISSAAQAVAVAMNAAQAAAQSAAATAAAQAATAAAAAAQAPPSTLPPLPAPPTVLPLPIIPVPTPEHSYYSCDICGLGIQGRRWHCQKCADYDVCETCYNKISAETHRRQTSPSSPPSPLFTQLLTSATDPAKHQAIQIHADGQHPWIEETSAIPPPPPAVPPPVIAATSTPAS